MGWSFYADTPDRIIRDVTHGGTDDYTTADETGLLSGRTTGFVIWHIVAMPRRPDLHGFIACTLVERSGQWGYKPMSEDMGPFFYSCPLSYLERVPVVNEAWRNRVHAYHAARAEKCERMGIVVDGHGMVARTPGDYSVQTVRRETRDYSEWVHVGGRLLAENIARDLVSKGSAARVSGPDGSVLWAGRPETVGTQVDTFA